MKPITPANQIDEIKEFWDEETILTVKDIVQITGITKRTLQYYDKINLLKPIYLTENGYRLYDKNSLARLQMILFLKKWTFL